MLLVGALFLAFSALTPPEAAATAPPETGHRATTPPPERSGPAFVKGRVLVKFRPGTTAAELKKTNQRLGARTERRFRDPRLEAVEFDAARPVSEVVALYENDPNVEYAEPDFVRYPTAAPPNDPLYPQQWALENTGQVAGTADADVDAPEAWGVTGGDAAAVVAVLDTGTDIGHPDLQGNIWRNPNETPGDGLDNDGNGKVDDIHGWDFYNNDARVHEDGGDGEEHGTHVAGTIAATAGNEVGISGVAPGAKVMPLQVCDPDQCSSAAAIAAFEYAASEGARIVNASWGGETFSQAERDAIDSAREKGVLFVFAAGNGGADNDAAPFYPASHDADNIISVAASDNRDAPADFSNRGATSVDLAAPGVSVLSTVPATRPAPTAVYADGRSIYAGFGLEQVSGATARQDLLGRALTHLGATPSTPILLVDDDGGGAHEAPYRDALAGLGFTNVSSSTVATGADGPGGATLGGAAVVVWLTGDQDSDTLNAADQAALDSYLAGEGRLLLMGQDIGYDIGGGRPGTESTTFYTQRLGAILVNDDFNPSKVGDVAGGPFDGAAAHYTLGGAPYEQHVDRLGYSPGVSSAALLSVDEDPTYRTKSGTSMAAPHVSSVAALLKSRSPEATHDVIKAAILDSADKQPALAGTSMTGGRLNARAALDALVRPTTLSLSASPTVVDYMGETVLSGELVGAGSPLPGQDVTLWRSTDGGQSWTQDGTAPYNPASGRYETARSLTANVTFQLRFVGAASYEKSASPPVTVEARARLSRPVAPKKVRTGAKITVRGYLEPYHQDGTTRLNFYRIKNGRWRLHGSAEAPNAAYKDHTRYQLSGYKIPYAGKWRVEAYHDDADHAPTRSEPAYFSAR